MPIQRVTRKQLITQVLDPELHRVDRLIAARALVRNYPAVIKDLDALVVHVAPMLNPPTEVFDLLADAWADVYPEGRKPNPGLKIK